LLVTVCTKDRKPILAKQEVFGLIRRAWAQADSWQVGRFVVMPDHLHFFCSPGREQPADFKLWMAYWKRLSAMEYKTVRGDAHPPGGRASPCAQTSRRGTLWQQNFWDRQLRSGEHYDERWAYPKFLKIWPVLEKISDFVVPLKTPP
jgi:REP element-mobilizing transposase RayT